MKKLRIMVSGGGTGGHIFPAVSIANALKAKLPDCDILFVGAEGRMEMERVPAAGYKIVGLPISGFNRQNPLKNVGVVVRLAKSLWKARKIVKDFAPDVAVGVGGYASGAALWAAASAGVPCLIQEQNSYAGVTNKLLAKKAKRICVAYEGMERFFPKEKIVLTGNPVRQNLTAEVDKKAAYESFGFDEKKKTLLVIGGSLGARTINESMIAGLTKLQKEEDVQVLWQTGKIYFENVKAKAREHEGERLKITDFVSRMDYAYNIADLVISRAGASSISELCLLGKPSVLVPSPNVAEDHQRKNAEALAKCGAAVMVMDGEAKEKMIDAALSILRDKEQLEELGRNAKKMAQEDSAARIAEEVIALTRNKE